MKFLPGHGLTSLVPSSEQPLKPGRINFIGLQSAHKTKDLSNTVLRQLMQKSALMAMLSKHKICLRKLEYLFMTTTCSDSPGAPTSGPSVSRGGRLAFAHFPLLMPNKIDGTWVVLGLSPLDSTNKSLLNGTKMWTETPYYWIGLYPHLPSLYDSNLLYFYSIMHESNISRS